jgi:hypothetical protein
VPGPLLYIDTSEIRKGALEHLKPAIEELASFVEANEPQIIAYNVYLSDDGARMNVIHLHRDSASLEYHMDVAAPAFRRFVDLVTMLSIQVYGDPSEKVLTQLRGKAQLLGSESVVVHAHHAGFTRF